MPEKSKTRNIQNSLRLVEDSFQSLMAVVQKHRGRSITPDSHEAQEIHKAYDKLETELIALVHQQTLQLHHPYVRYYLMSWPGDKDFLRKLHRGLETGIRREMKPCHLLILLALWEGHGKHYWSLHRIQKSLENRNLTKRRSPQAFTKLAKKLLSLRGIQGPFYNPLAVPKLEDIPEYIKKWWGKADANLRENRLSPEVRKLMEDELEEEHERRRSHFGKDSKKEPKS
jgi:hypothetical protein